MDLLLNYELINEPNFIFPVVSAAFLVLALLLMRIVNRLLKTFERPMCNGKYLTTPL